MTAETTLAPSSEAERPPGLPSRVWQALVESDMLHHGSFVVGAAMVAVVLLCALLADVIAPYSPFDTASLANLQPPSTAHWLGSDEFGRDILSRIIYGARISLQVAVISVGIGMTLGSAIGLIAGYYGGLLDGVLMRLLDVLWSFPAILLALVVMASLGPNLNSAMIAIGIIFIPIFARVARAAALVVVKNQYVEAARAIGLSDAAIILGEVLPNALPPILVQTTLAISYAIILEAALSFLGLGAQPPAPSWGSMLNFGRGYMAFAPWTALAPGLAIFWAVLGFNLLGDGLRDLLDPRLRRVL
jgi:peptide/nickel transport system permease protein